MRGAATQLAIELHKRIAMIPASPFILTLMGVSLSARKRKERGMGLALAVVLSQLPLYPLYDGHLFLCGHGSYVAYACSLVVNLVYLAITFVLYRLAPR